MSLNWSKSLWLFTKMLTRCFCSAAGDRMGVGLGSEALLYWPSLVGIGSRDQTKARHWRFAVYSKTFWRATVSQRFESSNFLRQTAELSLWFKEIKVVINYSILKYFISKTLSWAILRKWRINKRLYSDRTEHFWGWKGRPNFDETSWGGSIHGNKTKSL